MEADAPAPIPNPIPDPTPASAPASAPILALAPTPAPIPDPTPALALSPCVPVRDLSGREVRHLLRRLGLPQLVAPFRAQQVDGRLLVHVECVQDLIDLDAQLVKPLLARRLFAELADWKGEVSREMLLPPPISPQVSFYNTLLHYVILLYYIILYCSHTELSTAPYRT